MATLESLLPLVEPQLPGCPRALILQQLRTAMRSFCRRTDLWRVWLDPIAIEADVTTYPLAAPDDAQASIDRVLRVDRQGETSSQRIELGRDMWAFSPEESTLVLSWTPTTDQDSLLVKAVLLPLPTIQILPDWMAQRWGEAFAMGALREIKRMRPWLDRDGAVRADEQWVFFIGEANRERDSLGQAGPRRIDIPYW